MAQQHSDFLLLAPKAVVMDLGRKLMEHVIKLAISNKATRLQLETDDDNAPTRTLYKQLGFKLIQGKGVYMSFL
ncbi:GNAT family N-acetyltransferase [Paenibacillus dokdonensis]|uniref:GNAT family N-acetyltransferase n=1 Tax=Paenibacillus dokdonensis TaxID=2567944 RepID=A0ABU6GJ50_9BACL|nr:GNAT family N-acetyltransferase [Paenibacillus dokdonensis]MEC0239769.1 GNAT family N-acetyltransferase [Paenibacillus dokdonensis]